MKLNSPSLLVVTFMLTSCASTPTNAIATEPFPGVTTAVEPELATEAFLAKDRFGLVNTHDKRVDNNGDGYDKLYGTRNFRAVLANVLYRGGANNVRNREGTRPNRNPLPEVGLKSLCEQGFDTAVYMYATGFSTASKKVNCMNEKTGRPATLDYLQMGPYQPASIRELLEMTYKKIKSGSTASSYYHCWNGWHASGMISAFSLRQFCGYSGDLAVKYWDLNTDGNNADSAFKALRAQIRAFAPYADLKLTDAEKARVCLPMK